MQKIGFLGMGVMGLPMAKNVVQKCGLPVLGYDVVQQQMDAFREAGGIPVSDPAEIYKACDVILQILPTHPIIRNSVEQAIQYGKPGNVIVDLSSTAPDIILELYQQAKDAGMFLLDSPVSGGNPMAIAGTLAIMTGGDKEAFDKVKPVLACMGSPVYTGGPASGSVTKLVNNMIGGAILVAIAEGYAFAAKAGIDLQTTFEATRRGFAGGPSLIQEIRSAPKAHAPARHCSSASSASPASAPSAVIVIRVPAPMDRESTPSRLLALTLLSPYTTRTTLVKRLAVWMNRAAV